ncbi:metallophosphoesterase, partial [bacterium]
EKYKNMHLINENCITLKNLETELQEPLQANPTPFQVPFGRVYEFKAEETFQNEQEEWETEIVEKIFVNRAVYLPQGSEIMVASDLHGDLDSLHELIEQFLEKKKKDPSVRIVFLGDYMHRGGADLETLITAFRLKQYFPENVVLLSGNHETQTQLNMGVDGFYGKTSNSIIDIGLIYDYLTPIFDLFPLFAVEKNGLFFVHGGIPNPENCTNGQLGFYNFLEGDRNYVRVEDGWCDGSPVVQLIWNSFREPNYNNISPPFFQKQVDRGLAYSYDHRALKLLKELGIEGLLVGHIHENIGDQDQGDQIMSVVTSGQAIRDSSTAQYLVIDENANSIKRYNLDLDGQETKPTKSIAQKEERQEQEQNDSSEVKLPQMSLLENKHINDDNTESQQPQEQESYGNGWWIKDILQNLKRLKGLDTIDIKNWLGKNISIETSKIPSENSVLNHGHRFAFKLPENDNDDFFANIFNIYPESINTSSSKKAMQKRAPLFKRWTLTHRYKYGKDGQIQAKKYNLLWSFILNLWGRIKNIFSSRKTYIFGMRTYLGNNKVKGDYYIFYKPSTPKEKGILVIELKGTSLLNPKDSISLKMKIGNDNFHEYSIDRDIFRLGEYLCAHSDSVGLMRAVGSYKDKKPLEKWLSDNPNADIDQFFREKYLEVSPYLVSMLFLDKVKEYSMRVFKYSRNTVKLRKNLSQQNKAVFYYLCYVMQTIASKQSENKMPPSNLTKVIAALFLPENTHDIRLLLELPFVCAKFLTPYFNPNGEYEISIQNSSDINELKQPSKPIEPITALTKKHNDFLGKICSEATVEELQELKESKDLEKKYEIMIKILERLYSKKNFRSEDTESETFIGELKAAMERLQNASYIFVNNNEEVWDEILNDLNTISIVTGEEIGNVICAFPELQLAMVNNLPKEGITKYDGYTIERFLNGIVVTRYNREGIEEITFGQEPTVPDEIIQYLLNKQDIIITRKKVKQFVNMHLDFSRKPKKQDEIRSFKPGLTAA